MTKEWQDGIKSSCICVDARLTPSHDITVTSGQFITLVAFVDKQYNLAPVKGGRYTYTHTTQLYVSPSVHSLAASANSEEPEISKI